nr:hypothetical protein [Tanacetum cinerariifolium]
MACRTGPDRTDPDRTNPDRTVPFRSGPRSGFLDQIGLGPVLDRCSPLEDIKGRFNCEGTPPDVCVHNDTNLHSVATYAQTDEYQQCTTTKGVTPGAIRNTQKSCVRAPDPGYSRMATSTLAIATTNSTNNMDSTQSNCSTTPPNIDKSHFHMPQAWRRQRQLEFAAYSETTSTSVNLMLTTYLQHQRSTSSSFKMNGEDVKKRCV